MRWLSIVPLAACGAATPPISIAAHHDVPVTVAPAMELHGLEDQRLRALPALPARRGLDLDVDRACRAHLAHLVDPTSTWQTRAADVRRLVHVASQTDGDCRIDADAMLERWAPRRIGGCMGAPSEEAVVAWRRVAIVATTSARRAVALRNLATLAWQRASSEGGVDRWIDAGDAFVAATRADQNDLALSERAVDAYENALRIPIIHHRRIDRAALAKLVRRLGEITDGSAADRARALRARFRR